jgi:hypothetical protein
MLLGSTLAEGSGGKQAGRSQNAKLLSSSV